MKWKRIISGKVKLMDTTWKPHVCQECRFQETSAINSSVLLLLFDLIHKWRSIYNSFVQVQISLDQVSMPYSNLKIFLALK